VGKAAADLLAQALPVVFDRFHEAAAPVQRRDLDALCSAADLRGLPSVFGQLGLLRDEKGQTVFRTESGPLAEVYRRIEERFSYGETASGQYLAAEVLHAALRRALSHRQHAHPFVGTTRLPA